MKRVKENEAATRIEACAELSPPAKGERAG